MPLVVRLISEINFDFSFEFKKLKKSIISFLINGSPPVILIFLKPKSKKILCGDENKLSYRVLHFISFSKMCGFDIFDIHSRSEKLAN